MAQQFERVIAGPSKIANTISSFSGGGEFSITFFF